MTARRDAFARRIGVRYPDHCRAHGGRGGAGAGDCGAEGRRRSARSPARCSAPEQMRAAGLRDSRRDGRTDPPQFLLPRHAGRGRRDGVAGAARALLQGVWHGAARGAGRHAPALLGRALRGGRGDPPGHRQLPFRPARTGIAGAGQGGGRAQSSPRRPPCARRNGWRRRASMPSSRRAPKRAAMPPISSTARPRRHMGLFALLPQIVDAVPVPVIAAGGIADARGVAAAFVLGASARADRHGLPARPREQDHADASRRALQRRTPRTPSSRACSPARGAGHPQPADARARRDEPGPAAFPPCQHGPRALLKAAAEAQGDAGFSSLWAGQASLLAKPMSARRAHRRRLMTEADRLLGRRRKGRPFDGEARRRSRAGAGRQLCLAGP